MSQPDEAIDMGTADPEIPEVIARTPHGFVLSVLAKNDKLSDDERQRVLDTCLPRYRKWVADMDALTSEGDERVVALTHLLNDYKRFIELDVIFASKDDFLYRQAGQIKIGASIMEEFLPRLTDSRILPELAGVPFVTGPRSAFAGAYFMTTPLSPAVGAGLSITKKNQDFTIAQQVWLKASTDRTYSTSTTIEHETHIAFLAVECKTNLDKTMFQEAAGTSQSLKAAVSGARYYVLCEWLDMTPLNSDATAIDEVIILRGKRVASNKRRGYAKAAERLKSYDTHAAMLDANPIRVDSIRRLVAHMRAQFAVRDLDEGSVLSRGYF